MRVAFQTGIIRLYEIIKVRKNGVQVLKKIEPAIIHVIDIEKEKGDKLICRKKLLKTLRSVREESGDKKPPYIFLSMRDMNARNRKILMKALAPEYPHIYVFNNEEDPDYAYYDQITGQKEVRGLGEKAYIPKSAIIRVGKSHTKRLLTSKHAT